MQDCGFWELIIAAASEQAAEVVCSPWFIKGFEDVEVVSRKHLDCGAEELRDHVHVHESNVILVVVYSSELLWLAWK